jgi:hypothetical protein
MKTNNTIVLLILVESSLLLVYYDFRMVITRISRYMFRDTIKCYNDHQGWHVIVARRKPYRGQGANTMWHLKGDAKDRPYD